MNEEIFDKYIMGQMAPDERAEFEKELAQDEELHKEFSLHKKVELAIRLKAAKESLQKLERQIQAHERRRRVFALRLSAFAVAACLLGGLFVHFDNVNDCRTIGHNLIVNTDMIRGGDNIIQDVALAINETRYAAALELIAEGELREFVCDEESSEAREYARQIYDIDQQNLQWYKAITYMRMGKWIKAKRILKDISASDGIYKLEAQRALALM